MKGQDLRWSPRLKQCEQDLDNADNCRLVLFLVEDIREQLLYCLLPEEEDNRHLNEGKQVFCMAENDNEIEQKQR